MKIRFDLPTLLYGGSFDPVHEGHLHVARAALAALPEYKQLVFVPAARSPGKASALATPAQRLAWLQATASHEGFGVWDIEINRAGESFTVDTLEAAHALEVPAARLGWLLGADAYRTFPRWRNPVRIRELARLVVVGRAGESLTAQDPSDILLEIPPHPASSTALRAQLARGEKATEWLPAPVREALDKFLPGQNPYVRKKE